MSEPARDNAAGNGVRGAISRHRQGTLSPQHPFHLLMHEGKLTRGQLQAWALNRYTYQSSIPIKDAAILARTNDPAFRLCVAQAHH